MVRRTTRCRRIDTLETECSKVKFIDKNIDYPNWVFFGLRGSVSGVAGLRPEYQGLAKWGRMQSISGHE
jgi:hypothetical protein